MKYPIFKVKFLYERREIAHSICLEKVFHVGQEKVSIFVSTSISENSKRVVFKFSSLEYFRANLNSDFCSSTRKSMKVSVDGYAKDGGPGAV